MTITSDGSATATPTPGAENDYTIHIVVDGAPQSFVSLNEAVTYVKGNMTTSADAPAQILVTGEIELAGSVDIAPASAGTPLYVAIVAAEENVSISRAETFIDGNMFNVSEGATLFLQSCEANAAEGIAAGSMMVDGSISSGAAVNGTMVSVVKGTFGMDKSITLTGGNNSGNGGAILNDSGKIYLTDGTIKGNKAAKGGAIYSTNGEITLAGTVITENKAAESGAIYSNGPVYISGNLNVTGNQAVVTEGDTSTEKASNLVLDASSTTAVMTLTGALDAASRLGVTVLNGTAGTTVVLTSADAASYPVADAAAKLVLDDAAMTVDANGVLQNVATDTPTPTPTITPEATPTPDATVTPGATVTPTPTAKPITKAKFEMESISWVNHNQLKFVGKNPTVNGQAYYKVIPVGGALPDVSEFAGIQGVTVEEGENFVIKADVTTEEDVQLCVILVADGDMTNYYRGRVKNLPTRPANSGGSTQEPTRDPITPAITDSVVKGLENPLKFYPNTFYDFQVIGAGTSNTDPVAGDVKWVPLYWSTSSNPSSDKQQTTWRIGTTQGITQEATFNMYIFCRKYVYNGEEWVKYGISSFKQPFYSAAITITASPTPTLTGSSSNYDGSYDGSGSGYYDEDGVYHESAESYEDDTESTGASSTTKNAVDTADDTPIATMAVLLCVSLAVGAYILISKRRHV